MCSSDLLVRLMLNEALTPPFSANVLEKLSADLYDLVYGQPFRLPPELIFVMRALSTFEGVGRSLDPGFSLVAIARPYLLPLMSNGGSGTNELFNEITRQAADVGSRALGIPRRLDESLAHSRMVPVCLSNVEQSSSCVKFIFKLFVVFRFLEVT